LLGAVSDEAIENTPLTAAEQGEIAGELRELRDYVSRTYSLSGLQMRLLDERLDYLAAAASRVGRKDWLLMAAGLMLSYVLAAALSPEAARDILGTLLTSIGHILGAGPWGCPVARPGAPSCDVAPHRRGATRKPTPQKNSSVQVAGSTLMFSDLSPNGSS
jgi:hypothetical protein